VPASAVPGLLRDLPLSRLKGLGGEFGQQVQAALGVTTCGELTVSPSTLSGEVTVVLLGAEVPLDAEVPMTMPTGVAFSV
jgi:hypothetical protein